MIKDQILTFVKNFIDDAKTKIADLATTELNNSEKKNQLDAFITTKVNEMMKNLKLGWFTKLAINKLIVPNISIFTQYIYDLLKARIENVTK